jgi:hypothetical protein
MVLLLLVLHPLPCPLPRLHLMLPSLNWLVLSSSVVRMYSVGGIYTILRHVSRPVFLLRRVDCNPFLFLIRCPCIVAMDIVRCLMMISHVTPENVLNTLWWFLMAFKKCRLGLTSYACEVLCVALAKYCSLFWIRGIELSRAVVCVTWLVACFCEVSM